MAPSIAATKNMPAPPEAPETPPMTGAPHRLRIVLIRHGRPRIAINPRTGHWGFHAYIADYEEAGLDPESLPPSELRELVTELAAIHTSDKKRAHESAALLAPAAELIADPLFMEAPLASPRIPLLRMTVPKWAVVARVLWHAGFHPGIEPPAKSQARAKKAAGILIARAEQDGTAALVAHGYFNFLIGRVLRARGFKQTGAHKAKFWNEVIYEKE